MIDANVFNYILIPFDGSTSLKALGVGLAMARTFGARIALFSVEECLPRFAGDIGEV